MPHNLTSQPPSHPQFPRAHCLGQIRKLSRPSARHRDPLAQQSNRDNTAPRTSCAIASTTLAGRRVLEAALTVLGLPLLGHSLALMLPTLLRNTTRHVWRIGAGLEVVPTCGG
jgi:hypothetical protein